MQVFFSNIRSVYKIYRQLLNNILKVLFNRKQQEIQNTHKETNTQTHTFHNSYAYKTFQQLKQNQKKKKNITINYYK